MSAADTHRTIDRVVAKRRELGSEDFAAYTVLMLSVLAGQAPEVVGFLMDRADEYLAEGAAKLQSGDPS